MASFTKKVLGLAGIATTFAGMAFGQAATCAAPTATTNIIRAEGTTEQVSALTFVCTAGAAGNAAGSTSLQIFISPSLPVTSRVLTTATGATEAVVVVNGGAAVQGTVSGSTINFSAIPLAALGAGGTYTFVISNVRVNATSRTVGSGVPPTISETAFVSGSAGTIVPAALASTQVAFAQNGLAATKIFKTFTTALATTAAGPVTTGYPNGAAATSGANNFVICNTYRPNGTAVATVGTASATAAGMAVVVQVAENFTSSLKTAAGEASQVVTAPANGVVNGTRISVNFTNVPAGVTLWVPNGVISSVAAQAAGFVPPPAQIQFTNTAAGTAAAAVAGSTSTNITGGGTGLTGANGLVAVTIASGSGSALFEVIAGDANTLDSFNIPVFVTTTANGVTASSTPVSVSVSFSPNGSTVIPNFVVGGSTNTLTASVFNTCTTSLLFPFVTNQSGFDTGLAISNTSSDPFGASGATNQAGTCTLNFYGQGAPSPSNVTTPSVATGTVFTQVLSGVAAGFQGYLIAQCNFQFAHGFAFITNGVGVNGGLSQGYLAGVLPDVNQVARVANPLAVAPGGSGETLGN